MSQTSGRLLIKKTSFFKGSTLEQGDYTQGISRVHSKVKPQTKAKRSDRTKNEKIGTNESINYA